MRSHHHRLRFGRTCFESLERRELLTSVPFGATADDTAEFVVGDVLVSVVLFESDGSIDADTEAWTPSEIERVKQNVQTGLAWWEDQLASQDTVHDLNFEFDFRFSDIPVATGYEPISRPSDDFILWIEDFFAAAEVSSEGSFSQRIRQFNHRQRERHQTNWAFTILVVDSSADADHWFDASGSFRQSFAYAGGRLFVTPQDRPASTYAHEAAHMFWAMDEYAGGKPYTAHRGYYNTQNTNASDGHPQLAARVRSILDSHVTAFPVDAVSQSALETIGWRDSDGDGIFDVLDVPHRLTGTGQYDATSGQFAFQGIAEVQTLPNANPSGTGNAITLNRIDVLQARFDDEFWENVVHYDPSPYVTEVDLQIPVPAGATHISLRVVDQSSGVTSDTWSQTLVDSDWQNPSNHLDVDADRFVTPLDALLVINELNSRGPRRLLTASDIDTFLDSNGDGWLSPLDALGIINELNRTSQVTAALTEPAENSVFRQTSSTLITLIDENTAEVVVADQEAGGLLDGRFAKDCYFAAAVGDAWRDDSKRNHGWRSSR